MTLNDVLLFALLLAPTLAVTELSRIVLVAAAPTAQRKLAVGVALGIWRPWFYAGGLIGLIAAQYVEMPWRAIVYGAALLAIAIVSAIVGARAKDRLEGSDSL